MYADTLPELLKFARMMGMSESWLHGEQTDRPYFTIFGNSRKLIMREVSGNRVTYITNTEKGQGTGVKQAITKKLA